LAPPLFPMNPFLLFSLSLVGVPLFVSYSLVGEFLESTWTKHCGFLFFLLSLRVTAAPFWTDSDRSLVRSVAKAVEFNLAPPSASFFSLPQPEFEETSPFLSNKYTIPPWSLLVPAEFLLFFLFLFSPDVPPPPSRMTSG